MTTTMTTTTTTSMSKAPKPNAQWLKPLEPGDLVGKCSADLQDMIDKIRDAKLFAPWPMDLNFGTPQKSDESEDMLVHDWVQSSKLSATAVAWFFLRKLDSVQLFEQYLEAMRDELAADANIRKVEYTMVHRGKLQDFIDGFNKA